jgi:hypothetical protein
MHRPVKVPHSSFIEGSHTTKNMASACLEGVRTHSSLFVHYVYGFKSVSGLYNKNITIVNDASKVISKRHHSLEHHLWLSITLSELSIMLLES